MEEPSSLVGRVAFRDETCVRIISYNSETKKFVITPLQAPDSTVPRPDFSSAGEEVNADNLEFFPSKSFQHKFPFAKTISASSINSHEISHGSVVQLSDDYLPIDYNPDKLWTITTSCRIIGERVLLARGDPVEPAISVCCAINVCLKNANDIIEFEEIDFRRPETTERKLLVHCTFGKNITFRRCRFSGADVAVRVNSRVTAGKKRNPIRVVFEDCVFANCASGLMKIGIGGQVKLINCTFHGDVFQEPPVDKRDICDGVYVADGGSVDARCCSFSMLRCATDVAGRTSTVNLLKCTFLDVCEAVNTQCGCNVHVEDCHISRCEHAILCFGRQRSTVYMDRCTIYDCSMCIYVIYGKADVIVVNTKLSCTEAGVFVNWDVVGNIDLVDCSISKTGSNGGEIIDWSTNRCAVTVDGIIQPSKSMKSILARVRKKTQEDEPALSHRRWYKIAGVMDVLCDKCGTIEPNGVRNKICARCKNVCYCSRECQVAHWDEHRSPCDQDYYNRCDIDRAEEESEEHEESGNEMDRKDSS